MKYVKLSKPREATATELCYIEYMERVQSRSTSAIQAYLGSQGYIVTPREIRFMNEMYNTFKYIDITPKGRIFKMKGKYELVDIDHDQSMKQHTKAYLLMLSYIENFRSSSRVYGDVNVVNSMTIDELMEEYDE